MKRILICFTLFFLFISCKDLLIGEAEHNQNLGDFEAAWQRVNSIYPFLEFKNIDWDSVYAVYRPRAEITKGDEIYQLLNDLLAELKDGHAYYRTNGGGEVYPFYPARYFRDKGTYNPFVVRSYFDTKLKITSSESAEYEIMPDNIGYVFLSNFDDYYLTNEFPTIMEYFKDTKGLIIDIRQRRGGNLQNVAAIVGHLTTEPLPGLKFCQLGVYYDLDDFQPLESFYEKDVVVLINGATFSAGEWATEVLKQLPQVSVIGDTTGGGGVTSSGGSDEARAEFVLPSGKIICVGSGYLERYDGKFVEWLGVSPEIRVIQTKIDADNGVDHQLEYAISLLN